MDTPLPSRFNFTRVIVAGCLIRMVSNKSYPALTAGGSWGFMGGVCRDLYCNVHAKAAQLAAQSPNTELGQAPSDCV
jgi:hypothetical protein